MPIGPYIVGIPKRGFGGPKTKPPPNAHIDWQHPLSQGLSFVGPIGFNGNRIINKCSTNHLLYGATKPTEGINQGNSSLYFNGSTSSVKSSVVIPGAPYLSVFLIANGNSGGLFVSLNGQDKWEQGRLYYSSGRWYCNLIIGGSNSTISAEYSSSGPFSIGFTNTGSKFCQYINGRTVSEANYAGTADIGTDLFQLGRWYDSGGVYTGYIELLIIYNRSISSEDYSKLHYSPYQIFWIPKKRVYLTPPAGGTTQECAATMAGAGTLSGAASVSHALAATLPGAGTLSGTISSPRYLAGSLSGDGILTGAAYCEKNAAATFPGDATMQGAVAIDKKIAAILSGSFQMSARLYQESTPESYGGFVLVYNPTTNTSGKFILKPPST